MNQDEKIEFVKELSKNVTDDIVSAILHDFVPDDWDGIELRWYLAERFSQVVFKGTGSNARKHRYNNAVLVNNL